MSKIKITKKNDTYSSEYEIGDVFEVKGTWYGGVHILGKTGVPVSLDKEEYAELNDDRGISHFEKSDSPEKQERLESFEKMLQAIQKEYNDTQKKMEQLKAKGKVKSVTYQQLLGRKMMYQNMISMYELYNLI